jgi:hypothetical protein
MTTAADERPWKVAGAVLPGDKVWRDSGDGHGARVHTVTARRFGPPRGGFTERSMTIFFAESPLPAVGDEGQTVNLATSAEIAAADEAAREGTG